MISRKAVALSIILIGTIAAAPVVAQKPGAKSGKKKAQNVVVARVEGKPIYRGEVVMAFQSLPPKIRRRGLPELYERVLEMLIERRMMTIYGRREKVHKSKAVKRRLKVAEDRIVREVYLDRLVKKYLTEKRIRAHYDEFLRRNPPQDEVRARHILLASEDKAKQLAAQAQNGEDFAALARNNSEGPSAPRGGDLGYFTRKEMAKPFSDAAFKLKKGEVAKVPVKTKFGWHIIKMEDRRKRKVPPYKDFKPRMRQEVWAKLAKDFVRQYREQAKVERFGFDGKTKLPRLRKKATPGTPGPATK